MNEHQPEKKHQPGKIIILKKRKGLIFF